MWELMNLSEVGQVEVLTSLEVLPWKEILVSWSSSHEGELLQKADVTHEFLSLAS
jgi:hypothetical protein